MVCLVSGSSRVGGTLSVDGGQGTRVQQVGNANVPKAGGAGVCGGGDGGSRSPSATIRDIAGETGNGPLQVALGGGVGGSLACTAGCTRVGRRWRCPRDAGRSELQAAAGPAEPAGHGLPEVPAADRRGWQRLPGPRFGTTQRSLLEWHAGSDRVRGLAHGQQLLGWGLQRLRESADRWRAVRAGRRRRWRRWW